MERRVNTHLQAKVWLGFVAASLAAAVLAAPSASSQIHPPKPGVEMPPSYYERIAEDRSAFRFKRAWLKEAEQVRENIRRRDQGFLEMAGSGPGFVVTGDKYVPVLAGKFANTGSDPYTISDLQDQLFDGPNPTGTIPEFYDVISYGNINMIGTVYGDGADLFEVSQNDTYYEAGCNGLCGGAKTGEFLQEMLDGTDGTVDFGLFDNDGPDGLPNSGDDDGFVDFVAFVHPEFGGECGGSNIWSHRWVYEGWWGSPYVTNDPAFGGGFIRVSDYTIQPLISCNTSSIIEIGVYAHEFGHAFGLPDLYDTNSGNGASAGIGQWGLMGSGSYGGDGAHPETPTHMCAWSKEQLGWLQPEILCEELIGTSLPSVSDTALAYKVYAHGVEENEYFLIENRTQTGFDTWLPTSGLAIWHIDNNQSGNGDETHKQVDLEEADADNDLDNNVNRGDSGDLFPGSSSNTTFDDNSDPWARDYLIQPTGLAVTNIDGTVDPRGFDIAVPGCRLRIANKTIDDSECGDNSGTLSSNEPATLQICVTNDFMDDRTNVYGILTSLTGGVSVTADSVFYGTVTCGLNNCGTGIFAVESTGPLSDGDPIEFQLDLYGDSGYTSTSTFTCYAGQYVLLVEDDGGDANDVFYRNAIANAGYSYVHYNSADLGIPSLGLLQSALAVVWYTGVVAEGTLTPDEQAVVSAFLDGGGSLFMNGQDIGYDLVQEGNAADQAFYANYLHANYISDTSSDNTLTGVVADPVGNGLTLNLTSGANNSTWPSVISAGAGASHVFQYSAGVYGAVRYETGHRLVYFAFNMESGTIAERNAAMSAVLDYLIPDDITPPAMTLDTLTGGESIDSCADTTISWTASDAVGITEVELAYSDDGGQTWTQITVLGGNPGSYAWNPGGLTGADFRIKAIARDAAGWQGVDWSATSFSIDDLGDPDVTVDSPNGGEAFEALTTETISWSMSDSCSGVDSSQVWRSLDNGSTWLQLATVAAPDTSFDWDLPDTTADSCLVRVTVFDGAENSSTDYSDDVFAIEQPTTDVELGIESVLVLSQNRPNPFRGATRIGYSLPEAGRVELKIFDLQGRLVRTLVSDTKPAGAYEESWDARSQEGVPVSAGVYFYVLDSPQGRLVRKLALMR